MNGKSFGITRLFNTPLMLEAGAAAALIHAFTQDSWKAEMKPPAPAGSRLGYGDAVAVIPVHGILTRRPDDLLEFLYGNTSYEAIRRTLKKIELRCRNNNFMNRASDSVQEP
ncbi:MAG TPA: hypothetical protein PK466_14265 [Thermotogota bacterium]|nr:hypothetical protein [Thermotogota bacterium]